MRPYPDKSLKTRKPVLKRRLDLTDYEEKKAVRVSSNRKLIFLVEFTSKETLSKMEGETEGK